MRIDRSSLVPLLGGAVAVAVAVVSLAAFVEYFASSPDLIVHQGPLALRPETADELGVFFDGAMLRNGQVLVHLVGLALFWAVGVAVLVRGGSAPMRVGTAVMLILVGAALFAPLLALDGAWGRVGSVIGTLRPDPIVWRSAAGVALIGFALLFPTGRPLGRWWAGVAGLFVLHVVLWAIVPIDALDPRSWPGWATIAWTLFPAAGSVPLMSVRFARADDTTRSQIRLVVVGFTGTIATVVAFWAIDPRLDEGVFDLVLTTRRLEVLHDLNLLLLLSVALLLIPIGIVVSVVRYGLWDIGLLVNRALVYGSLTAMVAAAFLVGVVGIGSLLAGSFGRGRAIAGVVTGVVLVLVFQPVRRRVQSTVDRRFYREKYDAERAVNSFASSVGELVNPTEVSAAIESVLRLTVQPSFFELATAPEGRVPATPGLIARSDSHDEVWPDDATVMLPLVAQGRAVGAVFLGDRRSGVSYSAIDRQLLERVAALAAPAVRVSQLVEEQERQAAERLRIESEMAVARTIQHDLLPKGLPERDGWEFAAVYESAREVGGDYYDVVERQDGRVAVVVADVSGKGVPAAMLMATCRAVMRSVLEVEDDPASVLGLVNARMTADIHPGMFITCFVGMLDLERASFAFANAGHTLPAMRAGDGTAVELRATGMPFGWMPDADYETVTVEIPSGCVVVIPSDGVVEARDPAGEFFGTPGFLSWVVAARGAGVVDRILDALRAHCAPSVDLGDDVTMLSFARA